MSFRRVQHHPQAPVLGLVQKIGPQLKFKSRMTEEELGNLVFDEETPVHYKRGDVVLCEEDELVGLGLVTSVTKEELAFDWIPYGGDCHLVSIKDTRLRRVVNVSANDVANQFGDWFWEGNYRSDLIKELSLFKKS
jgi:hypothetical protein